MRKHTQTILFFFGLVFTAFPASNLFAHPPQYRHCGGPANPCPPKSSDLGLQDYEGRIRYNKFELTLVPEGVTRRRMQWFVDLFFRPLSNYNGAVCNMLQTGGGGMLPSFLLPFSHPKLDTSGPNYVRCTGVGLEFKVTVISGESTPPPGGAGGSGAIPGGAGEEAGGAG